MSRADSDQGTSSPALPLPDAMQIPNLPANVGTIACYVYASFYVLLEPVAGAMLAPILIGCTAVSNHLTSTYGAPVYHWAIAIHIFSWIAQFVGHGVYEGRAPALLDNLVQAILLAPFFVWMEILFMLGYRPELKSRIDKAISKQISEFRASKSKKAVNGHANGRVNGVAK